MKISKILGSIGLGMLAICAAGCSAETAESGESTGETRSPLELAPINTADGVGTPAARMEAISCVIRESGIDKLFIYGGKPDASNYTNDTFLYDPVTDTWAAKDETYDVAGGSSNVAMPALSGAQMINIPNTDKCLLVGGHDGTNTVSTGYIYDLSDNAWTQAAASAYSMAAARRNFVLTYCGNANGTPKILAIGGRDNTGGAGGWPTSLEVFDGSSWSSFGDTLSQGREFPAVAALAPSLANGYTKFIVAGGVRATAGTDEIDALTANDSCGAGTANSTATDLTANRWGSVAFASGVANEFLVTAGTDNGSNALATTRKITVTWNGDSSTWTEAAGTSLAQARRFPKLLKYSASKFAVVGGIADASPDVAVDFVEVFQTDSTTPFWYAPSEMLNARSDFTGDYLESAERAIVVGGAQGTTPTVLSAVETL